MQGLETINNLFMTKFNFLEKNKIEKLPNSSGVYCFKKNKQLLYIGKAANIKERAKNHFQNPSYRDNLYLNLVDKIGYIKTDSEIEALILEAELIKKHQPRYNVVWRDDKNYFFVGISKEDLPRVFWTHQRADNKKAKEEIEYIGPFVDGKILKRVLQILRRVFPYYSQKKHPEKLCPWCHLNLCPGQNPDKKEYKKNIGNLASVLKGKRKSVLKNLKQEMKTASTQQNFEKAAKLRDQIAVLEKTLAYAAIFKKQRKEPIGQPNFKAQKELQRLLKLKKMVSRIEAYDISNIQGQQATGSMVVFLGNKPDKNSYRKFKIKIEKKPNDVAMIKEVIKRRFKHQEWPFPDLILVDGGKAQLNAVLEAKNKQNLKKIKTMALAKKENKLHLENRKIPLLLKNLAGETSNLILYLRDEAHRFAIAYHHKLRDKDLIK